MKPLQFICMLLLGCLLSLGQIKLNPRQGAPATPLIRLLGPAAGLGRSIQWIRYQRANLRGDHARALLLAESAIALDPGSTDGWQLLAAHLGYLLASPEREHDLERRRAWFRAALEVTRRGAHEARHPEELHLQRALMLLSKMDLDPMLDERGAGGLQERAIAALGDARDQGSQIAQELLDSLVASD